MPVVFLESLEDPRLMPYRNLPNRNAPARKTFARNTPTRDVAAPRANRDEQRFVVEGRFLVERLLASTLTTDSILTDAARAAALPASIAAQTDILVLPENTIDQVVGFDFHRGMLGCGLRPALPEVDDAVPAPPLPTLIVVCSQVGDPTNLGAIMRNCAAFGVDAVLLGPGCADPFSRRVLRVSMGAVFKLPICRVPALDATLRRLTDQHRVTLVATVLDEDAQPLTQTDPLDRVGVVIGNEGCGLAEESVRCCQLKVTIPIRSDVDSLNAAVASGVFLYHFAQHQARSS